jgi:hypothetical protein
MTEPFVLREPDKALVERVRKGDLRNLDAAAVQRLESLRRLGVLQVVRSADTTPDTWSVVGEEKPKRSRSKG